MSWIVSPGAALSRRRVVHQRITFSFLTGVLIAATRDERKGQKRSSLHRSVVSAVVVLSEPDIVTLVHLSFRESSCFKHVSTVYFHTFRVFNVGMLRRSQKASKIMQITVSVSFPCRSRFSLLRVFR